MSAAAGQAIILGAGSIDRGDPTSASVTRWKIAGDAPLLAGLVPAPPRRGRLEVDLTDLGFVTPFDLVALVAMLDQVPAGVERVIRPPAYAGTANYLLRMDLPGALAPGIRFEPALPDEWERDETPALIELRRLRRAAEIAEIGDRVLPKLTQRITDAEAKLLFRMAGELVDNAATHGRSRHGTLVAAQHYSGATSGLERGMWLAIADSGIGIRRHLARNPRLKRSPDDKSAIRLAWRGGTSGTGDPARGWGLSEIRERASRSLPARLVVRSGHGLATFDVRSDERRAWRYRELPTFLRGTVVLVQVGLQGADGD
ncbi:MAG: hypothetical protein U0838_00800 [Chloroflexota bacterium]